MSCCGKGNYPSAARMAKDISTTVVAALRHAVRTGELLAKEQVVRNRIETCNSCEHSAGLRCSKCGCFISLKAAVASAQCPIQKW